MKRLFVVISLSIFVLNIKAQDKPNIILLFVDDLGWADLGYRNPEFHTPNIDKLKNDGMDFSRAYVSTATCSPSRSSILTGKEPVRFQMVRHITHANKNGENNQKFNLWKTDPVQMPSINWLPLEEITYAERLKEFGYYNMFIGKWHCGHEPYHPIHQGFDEQVGTGNHGHPDNYYAPFFKHGNPMPEVKEGKYLTDELTLRATKFIEEYDKDQPFMLSMWYYNVHSPQIGRKDWVEYYKKQGRDKRYAEYGAMVTVMDESVGHIRKTLKSKGIDKNTVIIFTSDQGGYFTNYPLRGGKIGGNTIGEGGSRVPFIVYYPGVTKRKSESNTPIQTIDVYPTLVEIASAKKCTDSQIQGKSLMPLLKGGEIEDRNLFFFRSYEDQYTAIIQGDWKLIKYHQRNPQLYNVAEDMGEVSDLIFTKPSIAKKLMVDLEAGEKDAVPEY